MCENPQEETLLTSGTIYQVWVGHAGLFAGCESCYFNLCRLDKISELFFILTGTLEEPHTIVLHKGENTLRADEGHVKIQSSRPHSVVVRDTFL